MPDLDDPRYRDHGFFPPANAAETAIFDIYVNHTKVPAEQRTTVRFQLEHLAREEGVRIGYQILASNTRKRIKRLRKS